MRRAALLDYIGAHRQAYDVIVIGGGASGAGIAWDAASRGLSTLLVERDDFGQGTSSRSTKLIHGGVRYLAQGRLGLVHEALGERQRLLVNAPEHVRPLSFLIATTGVFERLKYRLGLVLYDALAGARNTAPAGVPSGADARKVAPFLRTGCAGLLRYTDAQFDDARLLLAVLGRAVAMGACVLNYARVVGLRKRHNGRIDGIVFEDRADGKTHEIAGTAVINAGGPQVAEIAALDSRRTAPAITLSRGSHLVVSREFWPGPDALLMPRTPDGRVMFAIPWHDRLLLGTTDVPTGADEAVRPNLAEVEQILAVTARYLTRPPQVRDVLACFAGVRPLAGSARGGGTARASREYQLSIADSGMISLYGGKWTTFRRMAEACVSAAVKHHRLSAGPSRTATDRLPARGSLVPEPLRDAHASLATATDDSTLVPGFAYRVSDARIGIHQEMARSVEDLLARRTRALFLDAGAALAVAPKVAALLARELGHDEAWVQREIAAFTKTAEAYQLPGAARH